MVAVCCAVVAVVMAILVDDVSNNSDGKNYELR